MTRQSPTASHMAIFTNASESDSREKEEIEWSNIQKFDFYKFVCVHVSANEFCSAQASKAAAFEQRFIRGEPSVHHSYSYTHHFVF
ncbi:MAG: hypothetical protein WBZ36_18940 [Candidatus Nitrosopolaris sp.]|jgi:hypothetical protein